MIASLRRVSFCGTVIIFWLSAFLIWGTGCKTDGSVRNLPSTNIIYVVTTNTVKLPDQPMIVLVSNFETVTLLSTNFKSCYDKQRQNNHCPKKELPHLESNDGPTEAEVLSKILNILNDNLKAIIELVTTIITLLAGKKLEETSPEEKPGPLKFFKREILPIACYTVGLFLLGILIIRLFSFSWTTSSSPKPPSTPPTQSIQSSTGLNDTLAEQQKLLAALLSKFTNEESQSNLQKAAVESNAAPNPQELSGELQAMRTNVESLSRQMDDLRKHSDSPTQLAYVRLVGTVSYQLLPFILGIIGATFLRRWLRNPKSSLLRRLKTFEPLPLILYVESVVLLSEFFSSSSLIFLLMGQSLLKNTELRHVELRYCLIILNRLLWINELCFKLWEIIRSLLYS